MEEVEGTFSAGFLLPVPVELLPVEEVEGTLTADFLAAPRDDFILPAGSTVQSPLVPAVPATGAVRIKIEVCKYIQFIIIAC